MVSLGWLVACLLSFGSPAIAAPLAKVQITAQLKRAAGTKKGNGAAGSQVKATEKVSYALTVKNATFGDLPELTVDYILFVERQKLGEKKTGESPVERVTGTANVAGLPKQGSEVVTTDEVSLKTESLVGGYHYINGGRIRAEDSVVGVWVRVSQAGQLVGEYAMPSTIIRRGWEKK